MISVADLLEHDGVDGCPYKKHAIFEQLIYINDHFAKTGSGQT
jgi:hypothetical protein